MERWLKARQDKVWQGKKIHKLEKRWDAMHEHDVLMKKTASLLVGRSVLDVCCGIGHFYEYVKKLDNINYIGVDQSGDMLARARKRYPTATFMQQNLYALNQPQADTVVCLDALHHQPTLEPAFSILKRHAKKALIITLWIHEHYRGGKHKKQYTGCSGEIITWYTEQELQEIFSNLKYTIYYAVGYPWRNIYCFKL